MDGRAQRGEVDERRRLDVSLALGGSQQACCVTQRTAVENGVSCLFCVCALRPFSCFFSSFVSALLWPLDHRSLVGKRTSCGIQVSRHVAHQADRHPRSECKLHCRVQGSSFESLPIRTLNLCPQSRSSGLHRPYRICCCRTRCRSAKRRHGSSTSMI